jgi:ligand-binding sensor domain-containing protein
VLPALLLVLSGPWLAAQEAPIGTWTAYPSLQSVEAVAASDDAIWAATSGGVFSYGLESGEIQRFTRVEGLSGVGATAAAWDARRGALWVGYPDGSLDRIDGETGAIENVFDIRRAEQFTSRGINRLRMSGDSLLVSTSFGLVVLDAARAEVRDSYTRLGPLEPATAVNDALFAPLPEQAGDLAGAPGLWLATEAGVVWAPRSANLREPAAWTVDSESPADALSLGFFEGDVWVGTATGLSVRTDAGGWTPVYSDTRVFEDLFYLGDRFFGRTIFNIVEVARSPYTSYAVRTHFDMSSVTEGPDGQLWFGDRQRGLFTMPDLSQPGLNGFDGPGQSVVPEGPINNLTRTLEVGPDGSVWVGHGGSRDLSGVSRLLPDGTWERYYADEPLIPRTSFYDIFVDREGAFYGGTIGRGLLVIDEEGITRYDESNSSLRVSGGFEGYTEALDAVRDGSGALWVTNRLSGRPFHVFQDGAWQGFPAYPGMPNRSPRRLYSDRFGYVWFTLDENSGGGMGAIDPNRTPSDPTDDRTFFLTGAGTNGTGLPHPNVRAMAEDPGGRLWIGTERGLAFILSPGSAFGSDPALAQPVWARQPDGSDWFLRDLFIFDIAIDPAGRKWIGSTAGAWLTNAEGDEVLQQFTPDNSPLFDQEVLRIAVDADRGITYFATSRGLLSYQTGTTAGADPGADLEVFPNPLRNAGARIVVRNLPGSDDETASLKILSVDGQVVHEAETRGGTYIWDSPTDRRTGQPLAPGVYIVAAASEAGASYGKLAVIR